MKINVHIERLVLDGLPVSANDGKLVQAAVQTELARLVGRGDVSSGLLSGGAVPVLRTEFAWRNEPATPALWGSDIARAVHDSIEK